MYTKIYAVIPALLLLACSSTTPTAGPNPDGAKPDAAADSLIEADSQPPDDTTRPDLAPDLEPDIPRIHQPLRAGAASVDITPPTAAGVPLGGYGGEPRRVLTETLTQHIGALFGDCLAAPGKAATLFKAAEGSHDPVTAKAVVLDNGLEKAAIIKLDTIGVSANIRDDIVAAAKPLGIPDKNLMLAATHTHSGPAAITEMKLWQLAAMDCFSQETYDRVRDQIIGALKAANDALQPASIGYGEVEEKNASRNRTGRPGVYDPALGVIKIVDAQDKPIATVLNFAVHGTCLDADNMLFSADLMGYAERDLEQKIGGVAMFLNAAQGDVSPEHDDFDGAEKVGTLLASRAADLQGTLSTEQMVELAGSLSVVTMPAAQMHPSLDGCFPVGDGKTHCDYLGTGYKVPISDWMQKQVVFAALRIDDLVLAAVPGEPITDIGTEIKARGKTAGFDHTFVIGLANDHVGYINTASEYQREEYEMLMSFYGETLGQVVVDALSDRINALAP